MVCSRVQRWCTRNTVFSPTPMSLSCAVRSCGAHLVQRSTAQCSGATAAAERRSPTVRTEPDWPTVQSDQKLQQSFTPVQQGEKEEYYENKHGWWCAVTTRWTRASFLTAARSAKKKFHGVRTPQERTIIPGPFGGLGQRRKSRSEKQRCPGAPFSIFEGLPAVPSQIGQQLQHQRARRRANPRSLHFAYGGH